MTRMDGKVALVTGASAGIGRETALAFARAGAKVVVSDVADEGGEETVRRIVAEGGSAIYVHADVSRSEEVEALVSRTIEAFDRLDFAFNNAGIEEKASGVTTCEEASWDRILDVNLKGVWLCMKHQVPHMLKQGGGAIVNCASIAGVVAFPNLPAYVASKHGVIGLTRAAALEYATQGIRINVICPGVIRTPMVERATSGSAETADQLAHGAPIGRMGEPEEIADAVLWLCSDGASFVLGHPLVVDGGWVVR